MQSSKKQKFRNIFVPKDSTSHPILNEILISESRKKLEIEEEFNPIIEPKPPYQENEFSLFEGRNMVEEEGEVNFNGECEAHVQEE